MRRSLKKQALCLALAGLGLAGVCTAKVEAENYGPLFGGAINLANGDTVTADNGNAIFTDTGIVINGSASVTVNGNGTGIYVDSSTMNNLGDNTSIIVGGDGTGLYVSSASASATHLNITVNGDASVTGIDVHKNSYLDLGQGGTITLNGSASNIVGLSVIENSEVKANGLSINLTGAGPDSTGIGLNIGDWFGDEAKVDLGSYSKIDTSAAIYGTGIVANAGSLKADHLILTTNTRQLGLEVRERATVDLGTGSKVITNGDTGYSDSAIWLAGGTLTADALTIDTASGYGLAVNSGNVSIGAGSTIDGSRGDNTVGIVMYGGAVDFKGTADNRNKIIATGSMGASISSDEAALNLAYTDIKMIGYNGGSEGLFAMGNGEINSGGGVINADNVRIDATDEGAVGAYVLAGGKINFTGDTTITAAPGGIALATQRVTIYTHGDARLLDAGIINSDGKMNITGDLSNMGNGIFDLNMNAGSQFTGASLLDTENGAYTRINLTDGQWAMTGDSKVSDLELHGGVVNYATDVSGGTYGVLQAENLSGNGTFNMRTDLVGQAGDLLQVTGTTAGDHLIGVANNGSIATNGTEVLTLVETADGQGHFGLKNEVEVGGYLYGIRQTGSDWELYSTGQKTNPVNATLDVFSGAYLLNYAENQTLLQRMGDLRNGDSKGNVWARGFGGKFESDGNFAMDYDMSYSGMQAGLDKKIALKNDKGDVYVGAMVGYAKGNLDYATGSGSVDSKSVGVYGTYIGTNGFYADATMKYGWMKNEMKTLDSAGALVTADDMKTSGLSASLELGQRIHFDRKEKQGWYVEPQVQISAGHQSGASTVASNGLRIDVDGYNSILGRVGANVGYEVKGGKNPINVYGKVSYVHEFDGDVGYQLNGSSAKTSYGDSWLTYGVGITAQVGAKHNLYLDVEQATGGQFKQTWSINGGYRFSW